MAIGNNELYPGLGIPRKGEAHMQQDRAGYDVLTISLVSGNTDDLLVLRKGTTETLVVEDGGNVVITQSAAGDVGVKIVRASTPTAKALQVTTNDGSTERWSIGADGNSIITQAAAATVGLKILRASGPTSHAIKVADNGDGTTKQWAVTKNFNTLPRVYTTRPTTGLTKGEMMVLFHNSTPKIGICISTAGQQIKLIRLKTKTFGRLTA